MQLNLCRICGDPIVGRGTKTFCSTFCSLMKLKRLSNQLECQRRTSMSSCIHHCAVCGRGFHSRHTRQIRCSMRCHNLITEAACVGRGNVPTSDRVESVG